MTLIKAQFEHSRPRLWARLPNLALKSRSIQNDIAPKSYTDLDQQSVNLVNSM